MGGGHALSEGSQTPPCPEPIRQPGQVTVTVKVVGVQTTERDRRGDLLFIRHKIKKTLTQFTLHSKVFVKLKRAYQLREIKCI